MIAEEVPHPDYEKNPCTTVWLHGDALGWRFKCQPAELDSGEVSLDSGPDALVVMGPGTTSIDKVSSKQFGIVSWGYGYSTDTRYRGVYAKVQSQIDWINGIINE